MSKEAGRDRLKEFFFQIARKSFADLGVGDEGTITYVANLLARFARAENLYCFRAPGDAPEESIVRLLVRHQAREGNQADIFDAREMRKYVGDYTLFMSGIFRTHVEKWGYLKYYLEEGQRSYKKVSELDLCLYRTGFLLFQELADNFEYYSGALDYMRKAYFAQQAGNAPLSDFLKKVEGWIEAGLSPN